MMIQFVDMKQEVNQSKLISTFCDLIVLSITKKIFEKVFEPTLFHNHLSRC